MCWRRAWLPTAVSLAVLLVWLSANLYHHLWTSFPHFWYAGTHAQIPRMTINPATQPALYERLLRAHCTRLASRYEKMSVYCLCRPISLLHSSLFFSFTFSLFFLIGLWREHVVPYQLRQRGASMPGSWPETAGKRERDRQRQRAGARVSLKLYVDQSRGLQTFRVHTSIAFLVHWIHVCVLLCLSCHRRADQQYREVVRDLRTLQVSESLDEPYTMEVWINIYIYKCVYILHPSTWTSFILRYVSIYPLIVCTHLMLSAAQ